MTAIRQNAAARVKQFKLAISRIEHGRTNSGVTKLSVTAVAKEAGVSAALIHNHYPLIAEEIRAKLGRSSRQQLDGWHAKVGKLKSINKGQHEVIKDLRSQVAALASINETLSLENRSLRAALNIESVSFIHQKSVSSTK